MQVIYTCGCRQVTMFSGMLHDRYCWSCNMPADVKKMKPVKKEATHVKKEVKVTV